MKKNTKDTDPQETREWLESVDEVLNEGGQERLKFLLEKAIEYGMDRNINEWIYINLYGSIYL